MNSATFRIVHRLVLVVLAVYWTSMFVGTHVPVPDLDGLGVRDKTLHFSGYFGLGFLLSWVLLRLRPTIVGAMATLLIVSAYGVADELTQELVPSRSADAWDWVADVGGGMMGMAFYLASLGVGCVCCMLCRSSPANTS